MRRYLCRSRPAWRRAPSRASGGRASSAPRRSPPRCCSRSCHGRVGRLASASVLLRRQVEGDLRHMRELFPRVGGVQGCFFCTAADGSGQGECHCQRSNVHPRRDVNGALTVPGVWLLVTSPTTSNQSPTTIHFASTPSLVFPPDSNGERRGRRIRSKVKGNCIDGHPRGEIRGCKSRRSLLQILEAPHGSLMPSMCIPCRRGPARTS